MTIPWQGLALVLIAGLLGGTVLAPMKMVRTWKWDQTWLLYVTNAYLVFPWLVGFCTVPRLLRVYPAAGWSIVISTALFGLLWGFSLACYGMAFDIVGLSLTAGIILGSSVALGSLLPLALAPAARRGLASSLEIAGADGIMVVGVLMCALAGDMRERIQSNALGRARDPRFRRGLVICFVAGVLATFQNLALVVAAPLARTAESMGANPLYASNSIWSLAISVGALPSIVLAARNINRARSWRGYGEGPTLMNAALCAFMGAMWISGTVLYGSSVRILGTLGPVIGWPLYLSAMILTGNFWGWFTGEWKQVSGLPVGLLLGGIGVQIFAMLLLGRFQ